MHSQARSALGRHRVDHALNQVAAGLVDNHILATAGIDLVAAHACQPGHVVGVKAGGVDRQLAAHHSPACSDLESAELSGNAFHRGLHQDVHAVGRGRLGQGDGQAKRTDDRRGGYVHCGVTADIGLHALDLLGVDNLQGGNAIGVTQRFQSLQIGCFRGAEGDDQFPDALERDVERRAQFFKHCGAQDVQPRFQRSFRDVESGVHHAAVLAAGAARYVRLFFQDDHAQLIAAEFPRDGAPDDTASYYCKVILFVHAASLLQGNGM